MGYLMDIIIGAASRIVTGELSAHVEPMARWIIGKPISPLDPGFWCWPVLTSVLRL